MVLGAAKDARGPFFRRQSAADLGDRLAYREAYTTTAAQGVMDHLVSNRGLHFDSDAIPEPGKIVFVYRQSPPAPAALPSDRAAFPGRAARATNCSP